MQLKLLSIGFKILAWVLRTCKNRTATNLKTQRDNYL